MENMDYIVGIDVGSSSVVMAVGVRGENNEIKVLGTKTVDVADSMKDGNVVNYIELGKAIDTAKQVLERKLSRRLNSAYVGISGRSVYCVRYEDYVDISDKTGCVTENELRELQSRIDMVVPGGGDEIISRIPLRYRVDDRPDVKNPLGAFGKKLHASYLFVMVGKQQIELVNRAMHHADVKICGLCVTPTILHPLLLNSAEMEEGAVIIDMGSDLTDIAIVREGKLCYFSSLPIGASSINRDLHDFLKISKADIEKLKRRYGSAVADKVPEDTTIAVKTASHSNKQISQRNIAEIIEERLKDITGFISRELKGSKYQSKITCGAILTGGAAYLSNMEELFARELHMEVRLGSLFNNIDEDSQQDMATYTESAVASLLLYGAEHNACDTVPGVVHSEPKKEKESAPQGGMDIFSNPVEDEPKPTPVPPAPPVHTPEPAPIPEEHSIEKGSTLDHEKLQSEENAEGGQKEEKAAENDGGENGGEGGKDATKPSEPSSISRFMKKILNGVSNAKDAWSSMFDQDPMI